MREFVIEKNDAGQRMDKFLTKSLKTLPTSLMYKYLRLKRIKLNGKKCEISTRLKEGDVVTMYLNDEFFAPVGEDAFLKVSPDVFVVYEDDNIILVNKPAGLVVHEDDTQTIDTLINRIKKYLYDKKEYDHKNELSFAPSLCNRIDKNTSGIVIAAKTAAALRILNQKIRDRELKKEYLCIVHGHLPEKSALKKAYLIKDSNENRVKVFSIPQKDAKTILTKYKTLDTTSRFSLLNVELLTGRTHQIRAHMAFLNHALLGDTKYGTAKLTQGTPYRYQALCAYKLTFDFKTNAEELNYLNGKTFEIKDIPFVTWFEREKENEKSSNI